MNETPKNGNGGPGKQPRTEDHTPRNGTPPERMSLEALISEAESLRSLLHDAGLRSARLVAVLKQQRRQSRALRTAIDSLRDLRLTP